MSDKTNFESYIPPFYSVLKTNDGGRQGDFSAELLSYLEQYPELLKNKSFFQCLCYCYDFYINYDPASRDLPLQEKIRLAGEMAKNFLGVIKQS